MCGIWGYITEEHSNGAMGRARFVHQSAVAGTFRGDDSTGTIIVPHREKPAMADWCKSLGTGEEFLATKYAKEKLEPFKAGNYRAVLGHNRSATRGSVSLDNAHPFVHGPITLVHNGTLDTVYGLPTPGYKLKDEKEQNIEVDSHMICANLAEHDWKEVLESLNGAFALVWHDARNDSIYMARNGQRPLHMLRATCERTVLYASEADMLWWLAGRNNFARAPIQQLDAHVLLEFKVGELRPVARRFNPYTPKFNSHYGGPPGNGVAALPTPTTAASGGSVPETTGNGTATISGAQTGVNAHSTKAGVKELEKLGFKPTDMLKFVVSDLHPTSIEHVAANGWAYHQRGPRVEHIQGLVYGLSAQFARENKDNDWLVRPLGVKYLFDTAGTPKPVLVLRLTGVKPAEGAPKKKPEEKKPDTVELYKGPDDTWLSVTDWLIATCGGCIECGTALSLEDAEDTVWVSDKKRPLCPNCVLDWRDEGRRASRGEFKCH